MRIAFLSVIALAVLVASSARAGGASQPQTAQLAVTERGFEPAQLNLKAGTPVNLVVTRKTDRTCATQIRIKEFGVLKELPLNQPVTVSFTPNKSGPIRYSCGMGMLFGTLNVE